MFGRLLQQTRVQARVSLREFGKAVGLSAVYISDIEAGSRRPPAPSMVKNMAGVLGVDPGPLLRAAIAERDAIELPLSGDKETKRAETALALARSWEELDDDDFAEILRSIEERTTRKGRVHISPRSLRFASRQ